MPVRWGFRRVSGPGLSADTHTRRIRCAGKPGTQKTTVIEKGEMARETGLEPAASGVTGRRSNQLSYSREH